MRLLIVEQGINLRFWIHSNQPVNQILWNERRRELEKHLEHRGKTTEITVMLGGKCTQNFMVWAGQGKDTIRPKQPKKNLMYWAGKQNKRKHAPTWKKQATAQSVEHQVWKSTHRHGARHLPQGVFGLVGERLLAQQLPHRVGRGEKVYQRQEGLRRQKIRLPLRCTFFSLSAFTLSFNCIFWIKYVLTCNTSENYFIDSRSRGHL